MGLCVSLETESGSTIRAIGDDQNVLHRLLPTHQESPILGAIDCYGDTVFNRRQMRLFLGEWEKLEGNASSDDRPLLSKIREFVLQCEEGVHLYLKFKGD